MERIFVAVIDFYYKEGDISGNVNIYAGTDREEAQRTIQRYKPNTEARETYTGRIDKWENGNYIIE